MAPRPRAHGNRCGSYDPAVRIIVFGAGAVGSLIGGRLHQSGADIVLVARPAHADAIGEGGLRIRTAKGTDVVDVPAVSSLAALRPHPDDVVLITAKTQDTPPIHDALLAWNPSAAIVCGTNGVEHERAALRRFARVYGMVIQLPAEFEHPGEVTVLCGPTNALLDVGRYPFGVDALATELALVLDAAPHLSAVADDDIMVKKYGKLLVNLGNVPDAACGLIGRRHPLTTLAGEEGKRAYEAAGIRWEQPSDRVATYAERMATMRFAIPEGDTFLGGSTWQGLAKGATSLETDYFNGEIVLLGRLHGVATPANEFLLHFGDSMLRERIPAGSLTPEALSAEWDAWRS